MPADNVDVTRLRQLLLSTSHKPKLEELMQQVRKWSPRGSSPGQDDINRALVRALDEVHARIDVLLKI